MASKSWDANEVTVDAIENARKGAWCIDELVQLNLSYQKLS
jgi:hypothetical protein